MGIGWIGSLPKGPHSNFDNFVKSASGCGRLRHISANDSVRGPDLLICATLRIERAFYGSPLDDLSLEELLSREKIFLSR
jgi:hypothetical protein